MKRSLRRRERALDDAALREDRLEAGEVARRQRAPAPGAVDERLRRRVAGRDDDLLALAERRLVVLDQDRLGGRGVLRGELVALRRAPCSAPRSAGPRDAMVLSLATKTAFGYVPAAPRYLRYGNVRSLTPCSAAVTSSMPPKTAVYWMRFFERASITSVFSTTCLNDGFATPSPFRIAVTSGGSLAMPKPP